MELTDSHRFTLLSKESISEQGKCPEKEKKEAPPWKLPFSPLFFIEGYVKGFSFVLWLTLVWLCLYA